MPGVVCMDCGQQVYLLQHCISVEMVIVGGVVVVVCLCSLFLLARAIVRWKGCNGWLFCYGCQPRPAPPPASTNPLDFIPPSFWEAPPSHPNALAILQSVRDFWDQYA